MSTSAKLPGVAALTAAAIFGPLNQFAVLQLVPANLPRIVDFMAGRPWRRRDYAQSAPGCRCRIEFSSPENPRAAKLSRDAFHGGAFLANRKWLSP
jgi:hypothetical protein